MSAAPWLDCPECGDPLIEAQTRGRVDRDGNEFQHRTACRCRWCDWRWIDDGVTTFRCACGTFAQVYSDEGVAFVREVDDPAAARQPRAGLVPRG